MKKWFPLLLIALLLLTGCAKQEAKMTVSVAELSEEEIAIAQLLDGTGAVNIYDFRADETLKAVSIKTYELVDGKWERSFGGGSFPAESAEGRFALDFAVLPDSLRVAYQHEVGVNSFTQTAPERLKLPEVSMATMRIDDACAIEYENEIPLVMQIISQNDEIHSVTPDEAFSDPETMAAYGYDHVYIITVTFSQKPLN